MNEGGARRGAEEEDGTRSGDERRIARQILRRVVPTPDFRRDKLTGAYDAFLSLSPSLVSVEKPGSQAKTTFNRH